MRKILLIFVLAIGLFFRFNNLNWDDNHHLHPDERFLTMVVFSMKPPENFGEYFNQKISFFNPNNLGYGFYVYGRFPLILNKYLAVFLKKDNYSDIAILGRYLSAFFDLLVIVLIFKSGKILFTIDKRKNKVESVSILAAFFYTIFVLPIQLSHFFAVDSFLSFFMFGSFYFILCFVKKEKIIFLILSAIFFNLAFASKITAIFILPLLLIFIFIKERFQKKTFFYLTLFFLTFYLSLRLFDPYYFENKNFFNPLPNKVFIENIQTLRTLTIKSLDNWYPPMVQWLSKNSFQHAFINNVVFGIGIVPTLFVIFGMILILLKLKNYNSKVKTIAKNLKINNLHLIIILFWSIGVFIYQSLQSTPTLRYFIYLYPFFALFGGYGFYWFIKKIKKKYVLHLAFYVLLLIWPLMFSFIYNQKHTRVVASEWIYKNLPSQSIILGESWDDPLPLYTANNYGKSFITEQLPVFDPDSEEKWKKMKELLKKADYYILSSNRGWGSIPTVPEKYPKMSFYYRALLNSDCAEQKKMVDVCYHKIKEFTSYPTLKIPFFNWRFSFDDQWADESFTVYDHPKVMVFGKY